MKVGISDLFCLTSINDQNKFLKNPFFKSTMFFLDMIYDN